MAPFTIYKASAGSGKTFTLSREYIRLLFEKPGQHRRILAVTFTNKATGEMKARILQDLHGLSTGKNHSLSRLLCQDLATTPPELQQKSLHLLHELLHDYSHFSILTIDSFFQRIVRSFAREMGLYASYEVEIQSDNVINQAIDEMLHSMDDYPQLKEWLIELAVNKMKDGKSWDFHKDLAGLGKELSREEFQKYPEATLQNISDKKLLKPFEESLRALISDFKTRLLQRGGKCMELMSSHGLTVDDFKYKSAGVAGYLQKTATGIIARPGVRALAALESPEQWITSPKKTAKSNSVATETVIPPVVIEALTTHLAGIAEQYSRELKTYNGAVSVLKKLHLMGAISELSLSIRKYTHQHNLFLLTDTAQLLKKIISDADAPFVYEKIGSFFEHFMIDEFQDTSETQWGNFRPLITNSMASGHSNWVVGDVKQAIYRFRNTDWRILGQKLEAEMPRHSTLTKSLQYNWRSDGAIIHFNNAVFAQATQIVSGWFMDGDNEDSEQDVSVGAQMSEEIKNAYADCYQFLPESRKERAIQGHIEVRFLQDMPEDSWKEQSLRTLPEDIEALHALGYRAQDIAILTRTKDEAKAIAQTLLSYKREHPESTAVFDVLSNESLSLTNSAAVQFIVAIMRCLENPENSIHQAFLENEYQQYIHTRTDDLRDALKHFGSEWRNTPVYELAEKILQYFRLHALHPELPYIQAFLDTTLQYSRREPTDLRSFLGWWDEYGEAQNLMMPEGQNALRLMTIHKSKGLEFKAVLIPFCDWIMTPRDRTLWCHSNQPPLNQMELLAIDYSNDLNDSVFQKDYLEEKFMSYMDSLNMLYVAFTRAQHTLWVTAPTPNANANANNAHSIARIVHQAITQPSIIPPYQPSQESGFAKTPEGYSRELLSLAEGWNETNKKYQHGVPCPLPGYHKLRENPSLASLPFNSGHKIPAHLVQNTQWFSDKPSHDSPLHLGRILHELFSRIEHANSLEPMLTQLEQEGIISAAQRDGISSTVQSAMQDERVRGWFNNEQPVKTEATVLLPDGSACRPDRVLLKGHEAIVVDYKFGEQTSLTHQVQVQTYMRHLRSMGYTSVKGYLWYVLLGKTEEVLES